MITSAQFLNNIQNKTTIREREKNKISKQYFTKVLNEVNWKHLYCLTDTNLAYEYFLRTFNGLYNHTFPIKEVSLKPRTALNPWITKGNPEIIEKETEISR